MSLRPSAQSIKKEISRARTSIPARSLVMGGRRCRVRRGEDDAAIAGENPSTSWVLAIFMPPFWPLQTVTSCYFSQTQDRHWWMVGIPLRAPVPGNGTWQACKILISRRSRKDPGFRARAPNHAAALTSSQA